MVSPKFAVWTLLLLVLLGSPIQGWAVHRSCSVPEVLRHYQAVIFQDLQAAMKRVGMGVQRTRLGSPHHFIQKNLTEADGGLGQPGASCNAQKEHSILLSIKSLGRTLRGAMAGVRRGALEKAAWTVVLRTEAVMRRHCWTPRQSQQPKLRAVLHGRDRKRRLLRALYTVATCWEKLFALGAVNTRES
uniref:Predicted gene, 29797 n=1 Tax=Jaculus jaculus TaxID=51337 RepID=A0A8C5JZH6_JACJA